LCIWGYLSAETRITTRQTPLRSKPTTIMGSVPVIALASYWLIFVSLLSV
jgi:hypothetical protein